MDPSGAVALVVVDTSQLSDLIINGADGGAPGSRRASCMATFTAFELDSVTRKSKSLARTLRSKPFSQNVIGGVVVTVCRTSR